MRPHFKWEEEEETNHTNINSSSDSSMAVGLRILTHHSRLPSNVVVKYNKLLTPNESDSHHRPIRGPINDFTCFLQSCQLCHKTLCPGKDIYMYRGDQGFCSEECRDRQVLMDDMRELEASTKKMLASYRHCNSGGPKSETRLLLEELSQRRNQIPIRTRTRVIFS